MKLNVRMLTPSLRYRIRVLLYFHLAFTIVLFTMGLCIIILSSVALASAFYTCPVLNVLYTAVWFSVSIGILQTISGLTCFFLLLSLPRRSRIDHEVSKQQVTSSAGVGECLSESSCFGDMFCLGNRTTNYTMSRLSFSWWGHTEGVEAVTNVDGTGSSLQAFDRADYNPQGQGSNFNSGQPVNQLTDSQRPRIRRKLGRRKATLGRRELCWDGKFGFLKPMAFILTFIIVGEIVAFILAFNFASQITDPTEDFTLRLTSIFVEAKADTEAGILGSTRAISCWNSIQLGLSCCGANNYTDWLTVKETNSTQHNTNLTVQAPITTTTAIPASLDHRKLPGTCMCRQSEIGLSTNEPNICQSLDASSSPGISSSSPVWVISRGCSKLIKQVVLNHLNSTRIVLLFSFFLTLATFIAALIFTLKTAHLSVVERFTNTITSAATATNNATPASDSNSVGPDVVDEEWISRFHFRDSFNSRRMPSNVCWWPDVRKQLMTVSLPTGNLSSRRHIHKRCFHLHRSHSAVDMSEDDQPIANTSRDRQQLCWQNSDDSATAMASRFSRQASMEKGARRMRSLSGGCTRGELTNADVHWLLREKGLGSSRGPTGQIAYDRPSDKDLSIASPIRRDLLLDVTSLMKPCHSLDPVCHLHLQSSNPAYQNSPGDRDLLPPAYSVTVAPQNQDKF